MKHIKKLLVFFIAIGFLASCEEAETSYALQDVSAPTNVKAIFDISQDDTGTVKVTPTAIGATSYEIFFGDKDNESPKVTAPGETVNHIYAEGEFTLRIVAIGLTGLTSELSRIVTIAFRAPSGLTAAIVITPTNPFEITVTPSATNVTVYDVFFGDVENEEPKTIMAGESTTHLFALAGEYVVRIVARGAGSATTEITQTITISGAADPIVLPITFDDLSVNYAFVTFNGSSFEVLDNPSLTGANTVASKVGAITNSGAAFEGGAFNLGTPVDFSGANKTVAMKFWSNVAVPILLKFEGGLNAARDNEVVANHGGTGWEVVSFNFTTNGIKSFINGAPDNGEPFIPTGQYATIVIFVDGPGNTAGTFYIDDIAKGTTTGGATQPTAGPALPARAQANVLSIFSDVYTDPAGVNYFPNWGQTTTYEEIDLSGDKIIKYANANYQGIDFGGVINVTTYDKFHIDVWSNDYTQIPFFMISSGSGERSVILNVVPNQWNRIEIPLSDFTSQGLSMNDIIQFKLDVQPNNGGTIFLDNVYFYN
jgi:hypothetical protein